MEVSSHALDQGRVAGCQFAGAVFTNLTQDHLDYHPSMEAYFEAKALLFAPPLLSGGAVVNADDPWGRRLAERLAAAGGDLLEKLARSGVPGKGSLEAGEAELGISDLVMGPAGIRGTLISPVGSGAFTSPLLGRFNLMNLLQAVGVLLQRGLPLAGLLEGLASFRGVPGRMERVPGPGEAPVPAVLVDYAHTPDGLENALAACRPFTRGAADLRVRLRRRSRPGQTTPDGLHRRPPRRRGDGHLRQPAHGGSGSDSRGCGGGNPRRHGAAGERGSGRRHRLCHRRGTPGGSGADRRQGPRGLPDPRHHQGAFRRPGRGREGPAGPGGVSGRVDPATPRRHDHPRPPGGPCCGGPGAREGRSPAARWLQLASVASDGTPRVRTLVFRGWAAGSILDLLTDGRSAKSEQLRHQPALEICWLLPRARSQFRLRGCAAAPAAEREHQERQRHWEALSPSARSLWGWPPPGRPHTPEAGFPAELADGTPLPPHFQLLRIAIERVDLLELGDHPHRRRRRNETGWQEERLNP